MNQKEFDVAVALVKSTGEKMDGMLHECALYSLEQMNLHGNNGAANRLLGAFNKSSRKEALFVWFNDFGMCKRSKDNTLVYAGKKVLSWEGETIQGEEVIILADENPFYDYTKEIKPASSYDVMKGIKSILARASKMQQNGLTVEHAELVATLQALVTE